MCSEVAIRIEYFARYNRVFHKTIINSVSRSKIKIVWHIVEQPNAPLNSRLFEWSLTDFTALTATLRIGQKTANYKESYLRLFLSIMFVLGNM